MLLVDELRKHVDLVRRMSPTVRTRVGKGDIDSWQALDERILGALFDAFIILGGDVDQPELFDWSAHKNALCREARTVLVQIVQGLGSVYQDQRYREGEPYISKFNASTLNRLQQRVEELQQHKQQELARMVEMGVVWSIESVDLQLEHLRDKIRTEQLIEAQAGRRHTGRFGALRRTPVEEVWDIWRYDKGLPDGITHRLITPGTAAADKSFYVPQLEDQARRTLEDIGVQIRLLVNAEMAELYQLVYYQGYSIREVAQEWSENHADYVQYRPEFAGDSRGWRKLENTLVQRKRRADRSVAKLLPPHVKHLHLGW